MSTEKTCNCQVCEQNRIFTKHLELIPPSERGYFEVVYDDLLNKSADLDYYEAIMSGAWPGAVGILERALERALNAQAVRSAQP